MQIRVVPCWGWYLPNTRHGCDRALLNTSQGCNRCLLHKFRLYLVLGFLLWCKSRLHCFGASVWLKVKNVIWRQFVQFKMYCVGVPVENWIILFCYGMPVLNKSRNDVVLGRLLLCSSRQSACLCDGMNAIVGHVHLQVYQCNSMQGALLQRERERERERVQSSFFCVTQRQQLFQFQFHERWSVALKAWAALPSTQPKLVADIGSVLRLIRRLIRRWVK